MQPSKSAEPGAKLGLKPGPLPPNTVLFPPCSVARASNPTLVPALRRKNRDWGTCGFQDPPETDAQPMSEIKKQAEGGLILQRAVIGPRVRIKQTSQEPLIGR